MDSDLDYIRRIMEGTVENSDELWEWPVVASHQQHAERVALLRPIPYEMLYEMDTSLEQESPETRVGHNGKGLSLNISSGGMLLIMDHPPKVNQAMRIHVPTPVNIAKTPTLVEVRWTRKLPFQTFDGLYFVGLMFVL